MAAINALQRQLYDYKKWRDDLVTAIGDYQSWIEQQGLGSGEDDLRTYELLDVLKSDKLTIALVAEFSRGKTELVNAIFFADYKQRLLPSRAGHTTLCPTELAYDEKLPACIRLLPIETRTTNLTIAEYKRIPKHWTQLALDLGQPKKMAQRFQEIVKTKSVSPERARELGLYYSSNRHGATPLTIDGKVEIPVWRYASINYPHLMLKQGLAILDTPGLNSLGTEPELTLNMIPTAQAVLFVLAADTGVTQSDLDVWRNHVRMPKQAKKKGCIAVLNKIDTLWDELQEPDSISASISQQAQETARTLGIAEEQVFPVSAQKGLVSKIKSDHSLLRKSGLLALEIKLSDDIITGKQEIVRAKVMHEIGGIIETTGAKIDARLAATETQLRELKQLKGTNRETMVETLMHMIKENREYELKLESFQASRELISEQTRILFGYLNIANMNDLIARTCQEMYRSLTTQGMKQGMKTFFEGTLELMEKIERQAQQIKTVVNGTYAKFPNIRTPGWIRPINFSVLSYRVQLQNLHDEAEVFRNSMTMVMTEQHFVIKKFLTAMVSRARQIFLECHNAARNWNKVIMAPLLAQIREHKVMMDRRLDNIQHILADLDTLAERIQEMESTKQNLENQRKITCTMLRKIHRSLPLSS